MNKILSIVMGAALLSAQVASAQVTESDLMATGMPALQAETVYDLATQGTVADDLAIGGDVVSFAASGTITTTGATSDLTLNPQDTLILQADGDINRIFTLNSSSDTSFGFTFGDAATASQDVTILSASSDGADNDSFSIGSGGSASQTRGAFLSLFGNEYAAADGVAQLYSGNVSGAYVEIKSGAANGAINFITVSTQALSLDSSQNATFAADITSTATGDVGWSVISAANQACTTTCTNAAVFGFDSGTSAIVGPSTATADICVCAGAS